MALPDKRVPYNSRDLIHELSLHPGTFADQYDIERAAHEIFIEHADQFPVGWSSKTVIDFAREEGWVRYGDGSSPPVVTSPYAYYQKGELLETKYRPLVIKDYELWSVYLNESQWYLGRLYIALNREGNLDWYEDLTEAERNAYFDIARNVRRALRQAFAPDDINEATLKMVWKHQHVHHIPRYKSERTFAGVTFTDVNKANYAPYPSGSLLTKEQYRLIIAEIARYL